MKYRAGEALKVDDIVQLNELGQCIGIRDIMDSSQVIIGQVKDGYNMGEVVEFSCKLRLTRRERELKLVL